MQGRLSRRGVVAGGVAAGLVAAPFVRSAYAAGTITIAEVEELVEPGQLDPNQVHTPGIYVHRIFKGSGYEKRVEQRTLSKI